MINNLLKFNITKNFSLDIYNNSYFNIFNEYNKISCNDKHKLQELYSNNKCFEVPFLENTLAWGKEKVYYPFTSTLVKIVETYKGRTSVQFHPLKEENWFALNDKTKYYDGTRWNKLNKFNGIRITQNGIHSLEKNSSVLEIQDNNLFDCKETIRIKDFLNRNVDNKEEYMKYLIPTKRGKILKISNADYSSNNRSVDYLVFPLKNDVIVKYNNEEYNLSKQNLYFVKKGFKIINNAHNAVCIRCNYYEKNNDN